MPLILRRGFRSLWRLPNRAAGLLAAAGMMATIRLTADLLGDADG